jgi:hypothetical protein
MRRSRLPSFDATAWALLVCAALLGCQLKDGGLAVQPGGAGLPPTPGPGNPGNVAPDPAPGPGPGPGPGMMPPTGSPPADAGAGGPSPPGMGGPSPGNPTPPAGDAGPSPGNDPGTAPPAPGNPGPMPAPDAGPGQPTPTPPPQPGDAGPADAAPAPRPPDAAPMPTPTPNACASLPAAPLPAALKRTGPRSSDFTFDHEGYLLAFEGNGVVRLAASGRFEPLITNAVSRGGGGGLLALPGGDVVVADYDRNLLLRLEAAGNRPRASQQMDNPRKMARGPGGKLYVTATGVIYRVEPDNLAATRLVATDFNPNGITFSADYKTLYVSDRGQGALYALRVNPDGGLGPPRVVVDDLNGGPDGMTTDECGNVYLVGFTNAVVRRITPAGRTEVIADLRNASVSSLSFGSGKHGWDDRSLYGLDVQEGDLFEIKVGARAAPPPP